MRTVCVIGAGIVGSSVAFHLSRHGSVAVSVVDAGYPGAGVTEAGTGGVTARGTRDDGYRALRLEAMAEHHRLTEHIDPGAWLTTGGTLLAEDAVVDLDAVVDECRTDGIPVDLLSAAEVSATLEPNLVLSSPDLRVAHLTSEFTIAGSVLARLLFQAAVENGAVGHFGSRVIRLTSLPGGRHRVSFDDGTWLDADVVVNAAGANADAIARHYDVAMPMKPQPGMGIHVRAVGNPLGRMVTAGNVAIKPETDGLIRVRSLTGWPTGRGAAQPDASFTGGLERNEFLRAVVADAQQLLPDHDLRPIAARVGVRPYPADGLPRVGEVASIPGYVEAVMHSGGVLAPLVGRLVAQEIVTGDRDLLLDDYRPTRFLEQDAALVGTTVETA